MEKLQILCRPTSEFRARNDVAIHLLEPTQVELLDAIEAADKDLFPMIVMYTDRLDSRSNVFNGMSTWNQLRKMFGDVRFGEVGNNYGRSFVSIGVGFQIYFK
jgi:hypothetical protein